MFFGKRLAIAILSCCVMVFACVLMVGCGKESTELVWVSEDNYEFTDTSSEFFARMGRMVATQNNFKEKVVSYEPSSREIRWSMDANIWGEQEHYTKSLGSDRFTEWYVEPSVENGSLVETWRRDQPESSDPEFHGQWRHYTMPTVTFGRLFLLDVVNAGLDVDVPVEETDDGWQVTVTGEEASKLANVVWAYVEGEGTGALDDLTVVVGVDWDFYLTEVRLMGTTKVLDGGESYPFYYDITVSDYGDVREDDVVCPEDVKTASVDVDLSSMFDTKSADNVSNSTDDVVL